MNYIQLLSLELNCYMLSLCSPMHLLYLPDVTFSFNLFSKENLSIKGHEDN